jgi:dTDP-4-dehydrorhamnose reductase
MPPTADRIGYPVALAGRPHPSIYREPSLRSPPYRTMHGPRTVDDLEERLSRPTAAVTAALRSLQGDVVILGAGGKMGPSLTRMAARALHESGSARRVIAVSRFTDRHAADSLRSAGITTVPADLGDPGCYADLPDAAAVVFMAGQKFGTQGAPAHTWYTNAAVPALAAARYRRARIVAFSTGNVYPLVLVDSGGAREIDPPAPVGEYARSCLGRERMFEYAASTWETAVALVRLNYAVDLRYGVLVDIAQRVRAGLPVDLTMGFVNVIWQGDANAAALEALAHASAPAWIVNVTGPERLAVREVAQFFAGRFGRPATFTSAESPDALLSNTDRMQSTIGRPTVDAARLMTWVAEWLERGGPTLAKPTHFEQREGRF